MWRPGTPGDLEYRYRGVDDAFLAATRLGAARADPETAALRLQEQAETSVARLTAQGYSVRDISHVLRISPGRVSQTRTRTAA